MDVLVIEPRTKSESRFVKNFTKRIGIPARTLEEIEDSFFAKKLVERHKNTK